MIAQEQKPIEEILGYLDGKRKIVAVGCGGCATFYHTGDKKAVKEMAEEGGQGSYRGHSAAGCISL